jgi:acyl transferase domain-containing protein
LNFLSFTKHVERMCYDCRYGRCEGFAVAIFTPLSGDSTLVVGSAINQGGRSSGLTAPNGPAQTQLLNEVIAVAGSNISSVGYVAIHGTGTPLGDPIEVNALGQALMKKGGQNVDVAIGSIKSCFGHTEGAAGLTGAI